MRLKQWTTLRKLFSLPQPSIPRDKILLHLWNKKTDIQKYTDIFNKVVLGVRKWCSANAFPDPNRDMLAGKCVNWEGVLAVFWEHVSFSFKRVEIRKIIEVFWAKLYFKMSDLFGYFLLTLRFSATNSGMKKTLMMSTGTCGLRLYAWKNIFKKIITNMRFWIIYILVQVSFLGGLL